ncbi:MAG: quinone oxidoreductase family protein [Burkholderiales bacterium]
MKSYWIKSVGDGTALEFRDVPAPKPGPGQILLRVHAASLNRGDLLSRIKRHRSDTARPAGVDAAGVVTALGDGVTGFKVGDRVMVRSKGTFAEYAVADTVLSTVIPDKLSWEQAAAVPIAYITAYEALLQYGRLQAGEWLLIAGASSGVGVASLQIAKGIGAKSIGVSGSAAKLAKLKALGLDVGIQGRGGDFSAAALEATGGKGVDLAVNLVGGTAFKACLEVLREHGRLAVVGYVDGVMKAEIDLEEVHGKRLHIFGLSNAALTLAGRAEAQRGFVQDVLPMLADGRIVPLVDRVFPFDELPAAKAYVESDALLGKVVVRMA